MKPDTTIYVGRRLGMTTADKVVVTVNGEWLDPTRSQLLYNHSPDGFNYGYSGSGPAQLALAMLLDYYDDNVKALKHHQRFKDKVIATLPEDEPWFITGKQIESMIRLLEINEAA